MHFAANMIEVLFGMALFVNALLFIPQAIKLYKLKESKDVALSTFLGFFIIQLAIVLHAINVKDYILLIGYLLSMVACGSVVILAIKYRHTNLPITDNTLDNASTNESDRVEMLENIIAMMPGHVYWINREGLYLGCNDNQAISSGLKSRKAIIGKRNKDLPWNVNTGILPEALDRVNSEVMETGKSIIKEEPAILRNGAKSVFLSHKAPLRSADGNIIGMVGMSIDITERKKMEEDLRLAKDKAEAASQAKSNFMSITSHEIRGPLGNVFHILSSMKEDVILNSTSSHNNIQLLDKAILDVSRGIETIDYLLDFINLDLKSTEDFLTTVNTEEYFNNFLKRLKQNNKKQIRFEYSEESALPSTFKFNRFSIDKILHILLNNAVKYSKESGIVKIKVVKDNNTGNKNRLALTVEDNGIGIKEQVLDSFFKPLLASNQQKRVFVTPAIKLSYAKKLAELIKGKLEITSQENVGTKVTVIFPYEEGELGSYNEQLSSTCIEEDTEILNKKLKILIVEDNALTSQLLIDELRKLGQGDITLAFDGFEAEDFTKQKEYDVIFVDISLPGMDGIELKEKLNKNADDKPIIIAVTSHSSEEDKDYLIEHGFVDVISKPFNWDDIKSCLETIQKVLTELGY